jgi:TM2 domain-containing membrane protein YozV
MVVTLVDGLRNGMNVGRWAGGGSGSSQGEDYKVAQYGIQGHGNSLREGTWRCRAPARWRSREDSAGNSESRISYQPSPQGCGSAHFISSAQSLDERCLSGLNLGRSDDRPVAAFVPEASRKSAGRALALSLLVPGLGQFYCGKTGRGWATLGFWLLGLLFAFSTRAGLKGTGIMVISVLWIFWFLDAYFTAIEINRRPDTQLGQNPRVAVTLNLLTAGSDISIWESGGRAP